MSEAIVSPRFITGKQLVKELCLREEDYVLAKRMKYMLVLRDAFNMLNIKTNLFTKRVALPVDRKLNHVLTPADYLELSSIAAPDHHGKLQPMIVNSSVSADVADLSMAKRCGCGCGCTNAHCVAIRNFEAIYGKMDAKLPDGSTKSFDTIYQKIVLKDGSFVEQKTVPVTNYDNNVHVSTTLKMESTLICNLELEPKCGCIKDTEHNRHWIESSCHAASVSFECGCSVRHLPAKAKKFNMDEEGDRIYLPTDFNQDYIVMRYWANSKTKDIRIPYLAKEPMMSAIKVITTTFSKREKNEVDFWKRDLKQKTDQMIEDITPLKFTALYEAVLGINDFV